MFKNKDLERVSPPADPKGPPFGTFWEIHFWPTKIFLKCPKTAFLTFFQKFACGAENLAKTASF